MSEQKQSASFEVAPTAGGSAAQLYGFVLTEDGPMLYYDRALWRHALDAERKRRFRERPFGRRRQLRASPRATLAS